MKNILFTCCLMLLAGSMLRAQSPNLLPWQGAFRDKENQPQNGTLDLRFRLLRGSATGAVAFEELNPVVPVKLGVASHVLGSVNTADFANIDWSKGPYFLEVARFVSGSVPEVIGTPEQLKSVPYALESKSLDLPFFKQGVDGDAFTVINNSGRGAILATPTEAAHFNGDVSIDNGNFKINNAGSYVQTGTDPNPYLILKGKEGTTPYIDFSGDLNPGYGARIIYNKGAGSMDFSGPFQYSLFSGADRLYLNWFAKAGEGRKAWIGFGEPNGQNFTFRNEYLQGKFIYSAEGFEFYDGTISVPSDNAEAPNLSVRNNANIAIRGESNTADAILGVLQGTTSNSSALAGHCYSPNGNAVWGGHIVNGAGAWGGILGNNDYAGYFWGKPVRVDGNGVSGPISFAFYAKSIGVANFVNAYTGGSGIDAAPVTVNYSLVTSDRILAPEFNAYSDRRIKDIIGISNRQHDLETLKKIEITDYFFKDKILHGDHPQKKVIGQQLAQVYPQAVSANHQEFIPDIMQMASAAQGWIGLPNHTLKVGDKVRLISEEKKEDAEVTKVSADGFQVATQQTGDVFVYGRQVSDFHTVDYEAISMLNVSATQELSRQVEDLKKQLAERDTQITAALGLLQTLQHEVAALKTAAMPVEGSAGK
jgi:hypothetical protein